MEERVFLSHSSLDSSYAAEVLSFLEDHGYRCWIAPRNILPGDDWPRAIASAIDSCCAFVVLVSSCSARSSQVRIEVERAVSAGKTVVPVIIDDYTPAGWMEYFISSRHWHRFYSSNTGDSLADLLPALADTGAQLFSRDLTTLGSFISGEVSSLSASLKVLGHERAASPVPGVLRPVAVLCVKLAGISRYSGREADSLLRKTITGVAFRVIQAYGGVPEHWGRDTVTGVFGSGEARDDDIRRAISCAVRIMGSVKKFNAALADHDLYVKAGAGVACGMTRIAEDSGEGSPVNGELLSSAMELASVENGVVVTEKVREHCSRTFYWRREGAGFRVVFSGTPESESASVFSPSFHGRERERDLILNHLASQTGSRQPRIVELCGESGAGKTRLAREVLHELEKAGACVFRGRTHSISETPLYTWRTIFRAAGIEKERLSARENILLARVFGERREREAPVSDNPNLATALLAAAVLQEFAGDRVVVLFIDDVQWMDMESRRVLEAFTAFMDWKNPPMVLLSRRIEPGEEPCGHSGAHQVWVGGLNDRDTSLLMQEVLEYRTGEKDIALYSKALEKIRAVTGGLPLSVISLAEHLLATGGIGSETGKWRLSGEPEGFTPGDTRSIILKRLGGIAADRLTVLQNAAVSGMEFSRETVAGMFEEGDSSESPYSVQGLLEGLPETGLVQRMSDGRYRFAGEVIRETVLATILPLNRRLLHRKAGRYLESLVTDGEEVETGILFTHYREAEEYGRAFFWGLTTLEGMLEGYQFEAAVSLAAKILKFPDSFDAWRRDRNYADFLLLAANAERETGNWQRALSLYGKAGDFARDNGHMQHALRARVCASQQLVSLGEYQTAVNDLQSLLDGGQLRDYRDLECRARRNLGVALWRTGRLDEAETLFQKNLEVYRRDREDDARAVSMGNIALIKASRGELQSAIALTRRKLEIVKRTGNTKEESIAESNLGACSAMAGNYAQAAAHFRRQMAIDEYLGRKQGILSALSNLANLAGRDPAHGSPVRLYRRAEKLARRIGDRSTLTHILGNMAPVLFTDGLVEEAESSAREALELAMETGDEALAEKNRKFLRENTGTGNTSDRR